MSRRNPGLREHTERKGGEASPHRVSKVRRCRVSKYSVVMHELAEINLCLRNPDGAPQSTNQSHHANETVHPIHRSSTWLCRAHWHPDGGMGSHVFAYSSVSVCVQWQWRKLSPGMCCLRFSLKVTTSLGFPWS